MPLEKAAFLFSVRTGQRQDSARPGNGALGFETKYKSFCKL
jgi:hypothetical protein